MLNNFHGICEGIGNEALYLPGNIRIPGEMKGDDAHIRALTEEEFGRIFSRCRPMYVKIANSYIHDDGAAEDIVNECFIRMWERRSELKTENYEAYAFKSIVNRCLDHLRTLQTRTRIQKNMHEAGNRMQSYEISSLSSLNPESLFADEIEDIVRRCIEGMPDITRKVFLASRIDEKTYGEISETYGIPVRQVTSHIQFALRSLRGSLKDYLPVLLALLMLQKSFDVSTGGASPVQTKENPANLQENRMIDEVVKNLFHGSL